MGLKDDYVKLMCNHISISKDDLTQTEQELIEKSWELFDEKLDDLKIQSDEIKRLTIELLNFKSMYKDEL